MKRCVVLSLLVALGATVHAETNPVPPSADDVDWSRHVVEAYQEYQRQQAQTFQALQQTREAVVQASRNAQQATEQTEARLKLLEDTLAAQTDRDRALVNLQAAHQQSLVLVATVAGVAFFSLLLFALYLMRVLNRRAELLTGGAPLAGPLRPALGTGDTALLPVNPAEQATARFLQAIERLEKRLADMETLPAAGDNGHAVSAGFAGDDSGKQLAVLLGKGQTLLNLGKPAEALECFDAAIKLEDHNPELHVKRGTALEKLERLDEAIASFDRAIDLDESLTMAYLCKGGVYNRLERYSDALKCYEQALQSQEKPQPV